MPKKMPKRRAWRKADIKDVEEAVEDERLVKKLKHSVGAPKAQKDVPDACAEESELGDLDGLFTVDTAGSGEGLSAKTRREIARAKLFPPKGPQLGLSAAEEMKVARANNRLNNPAPKKAPKSDKAFDLWGSDGTSSSAAAAEFPRIRKPKYEAVKVPGTLHKKVGVAPAVLPAHEGQSLNPDATAYENLACKAAESFLERERQNAKLDCKLKPLTHALKEALGNDAKGLTEEEKVAKLRDLTCKVTAADDNAEAMASGSSGARNQRQKSQSYRNAAKKRKVTDNLADQAAVQRRLEKSVGGLGTVLKEVKEDEALAQKKKQEKAAQAAEKKALEAKEGILPPGRRLGKTVFVEPAAVIPDVAAASRGMRAARLKGSAITERLTSIARRGLINAPPEATKSELVRHSKKNARVKKSRRFISPLLRQNLLAR